MDPSELGYLALKQYLERAGAPKRELEQCTSKEDLMVLVHHYVHSHHRNPNRMQRQMPHATSHSFPKAVERIDAQAARCMDFRSDGDGSACALRSSADLWSDELTKHPLAFCWSVYCHLLGLHPAPVSLQVPLTCLGAGSGRGRHRVSHGACAAGSRCSSCSSLFSCPRRSR